MCTHTADTRNSPDHEQYLRTFHKKICLAPAYSAQIITQPPMRNTITSPVDMDKMPNVESNPYQFAPAAPTVRKVRSSSSLVQVSVHLIPPLVVALSCDPEHMHEG